MPSLDDVPWPVRTERLLLRPAEVADLDATWQVRRHESSGRWLGVMPTTLGEYRTHFTDPERLAKTIVVEHDGEVVGDLMLAIGDAWAQAEVSQRAHRTQAELGWVIHPDVGGRGFATEAVRAALRVCFEDLGLRRVTADCFADNEPSWRLMERVGMRREAHTVRDSLHRSGGWLDGYGYALLADEWRAGQAG